MRSEAAIYPCLFDETLPQPWHGWVVGWGFRAGARTAAFASCWAQACERLARLAQPVGPGMGSLVMAMLASRFDTPAGQSLRQWAATAVPHAAWWPCPEQALRGLHTAHQSARVQQRFATGSVCEALALLGAGESAAFTGQCEDRCSDPFKGEFGGEVGAEFSGEFNSHLRANAAPHLSVRLRLARLVSADRHATLAVAVCGDGAGQIASPNSRLT